MTQNQRLIQLEDHFNPLIGKRRAKKLLLTRYHFSFFLSVFALRVFAVYVSRS